MALHAVGGPRQSFEPLGGNQLAASLAQPERAFVDEPQRAFYLGEVHFFALAQLLAALTLGHLGGGGCLGAMRDPGMLDFLGQLESKSGALVS